jgi:aryl-alcohol dehydrogenase-like predicted oxidoreductase
MRQVALAGTGRQTSQLGFGCASLGGGGKKTFKEKRRLLDVAFCAGVTHFDTARVYGFGEAERVLGAFLAGRRDQVTVTTKLGLLPPQRSPALAVARSLARHASSLAPWLRDRVLRGSGQLVKSGRFNAADAAASLEESLRALRTDYVDLLLLHECEPSDALRDDLLAFLDTCHNDGRARAVGLATDPESTIQILGQPGPWRVAQIADSALDPRPADSVRAAGVFTITHSILVTDLAALWAAVGTSPDLGQAIGTKLGSSPLRMDALGGALLRCAGRANSRGVVLFASGRPAAIKSNVAAFTAIDDIDRELDIGFLDLARRAVQAAGTDH